VLAAGERDWRCSGCDSMSFYSNGLGFWFGREVTELSEHDQVLSCLIYYIHTQITVEEGKIARSFSAALGVVVHFLVLAAVRLPAACLKASSPQSSIPFCRETLSDGQLPVESNSRLRNLSTRWSRLVFLPQFCYYISVSTWFSHH